MRVNQISLKPSSVARVLAAVAVVLIVASVASRLAADMTGHVVFRGLARLLTVDDEKNIPSGFSAFLLLLAGMLLALITACRWKQPGASVFHWAILCLGFLFMAADEAMSFHEELVVPMRNLLGNEDLGVFYFAWVLPGIVLVLILAPLFLRFLWRLPPRARLPFTVAAILYLAVRSAWNWSAAITQSCTGRTT